MKAQVIDESPFGVYVWLVDEKVVADEDGNYLSINSRRGDPKRIEAIRDAAKSCGINHGEPLFLPGHRKVNDEEYEKQKDRLAAGLIPDELDVGAYQDEELGRINERTGS